MLAAMAGLVPVLLLTETRISAYCNHLNLTWQILILYLHSFKVENCSHAEQDVLYEGVDHSMTNHYNTTEVNVSNITFPYRYKDQEKNVNDINPSIVNLYSCLSLEIHLLSFDWNLSIGINSLRHWYSTRAFR